jgi:hypothetical protein
MSPSKFRLTVQICFAQPRMLLFKWTSSPTDLILHFQVAAGDRRGNAAPNALTGTKRKVYVGRDHR